MKIRPYGERLLVSRLPHPENSVIDMKPPPSPYGHVLDVGRDVKYIVPGESIYFNPYAGFALEVNGETFLLLAEHEVLGYYTQ